MPKTTYRFLLVIGSVLTLLQAVEALVGPTGVIPDAWDFELRSETPDCDPVGLTEGVDFMIGSVNVTKIHVCALGYITIDGGVPQSLTRPSNFNKLRTSTIVAAGLINSFNDLGLPRWNHTYAYYEGFTFERDFFGAVDPFWKPDHGIIVNWGNYDEQETMSNFFSMAIGCDYHYPTLDIEGNVDRITKCSLILEYFSLDDVEQNVSGQIQYMAVGVNNPSQTMRWSPDFSQTQNVSSYYLTQGLLYFDGYEFARSVWAFDLDQNWNGTGDFVTPYERSNCPGIAPFCEARNLGGILSDWHPDDEVVDMYGGFCFNYSLHVGQSIFLGNALFQEFYPCSDGYLTVGPDAPEILYSPSDLCNLQNSTIVAPGLIMPFETDHKRKRVKRHYLSILSRTMYKNITGEELTAFQSLDPFFRPTQAFAVRWVKELSSYEYFYKRTRREVTVETEATNDFQMAIACDFAFQTLAENKTKCVLVMEYYNIDGYSQNLERTVEYMAVGINDPDRVNKWMHPSSNGSTVASVLLGPGNVLIDGERKNGLWVYELSQDGDSQDILTEFQTSDCTGIAPDCEDDNAALMEFNGDAFIDGHIKSVVGMLLNVVLTIGNIPITKVCITRSYIVLLSEDEECDSFVKDCEDLSNFDQNSKPRFYVAAACIDSPNSDQDSVESGIFYRLLSGAADRELCDSNLGDQIFSCDFGLLVTWYHVGNSTNNLLTNSYQVMIGCDVNYNNSGSARCVLVLIYGEMNYLQNQDGEFAIAAFYGPDSMRYFFIEATNDLSRMANAFKGALKFDLISSDEGVFIRVYNASDFVVFELDFDADFKIYSRLSILLAVMVCGLVIDKAFISDS